MAKAVHELYLKNSIDKIYCWGRRLLDMKLYCGGVFPFDCRDEGYVESARDDFRARLLGDVEKLLQKSDGVQINDNVTYIGPFYYETKDMCDRDIVATEVDMIHRCTDAVFLLDDGLCPGTIGEMVFAAGLSKNVHVFYVVHEEETESELMSPCWHPMILSMLINKNAHVAMCKDMEEAVERIIGFVSSYVS